MPLITVDGTPLQVDTRKATALLAYLAVTGETQLRERLAELLWPDAGLDRSRAALRRTLSTLRGAVGDERLECDRLAVTLKLDDAFLDLAESRRIAADPSADADALAAAAALHRDDLLAGFFLRDSVAFEDWLHDATEGLRRERAALLDRLASHLANAGRLDEAVAAARARLALDELHEPTHRHLMELYAAAGRRAQALSQYRECVRVLDRELGVAPLNETTELYNRLSGATGIVTEPLTPPPAPVPVLALVGREHELRELAGARHGLVLIEGESGVGKTRLALEALAQRAGKVLTSRAHSGERSLAYAVVTQLLRSALAAGEFDLSEGARVELARLLPELGPPPVQGLAEPGAELRLLETIAQGLIAGHDVVFVDDLQWCDPASLVALGYLARRLDEGAQLLLLTARRSDEPDPEHHYAALASLGRRVTLGRLQRGDVLDLVLRAGRDDEGAMRIYEESEGLPLLVAELLAGDGEAAGGARALLAARVERVGDPAGQVLGAAALIGRTFDTDTLRAASGRSDDEVAGALEELVAHGLVVERDDAYDFAHEWLRVLAQERVGLARRRLLHRRLAELHRARHDDPAIVAHHLQLAGDDLAAALSHVAAAERAGALLAPIEAIAHLEAALALRHPDPASLHEMIGDLQMRRGAYPQAVAAYGAAAAYASAEGAGGVEHKLGAVHERRGEWELAEAHYRQALELGAERASLQADRARIALRLGERERATELGREALRIAESGGAAAAAAAAQANNVLGLLGLGREFLERSLELAGELGDPQIRIAALNNLAHDDVARAQLDDAERRLREAIALCAEHGDVHHEAALRNNLADVLHKADKRDAAMEELKLAVAGFATVGSDGDEFYPGAWSLVEW